MKGELPTDGTVEAGLLLLPLAFPDTPLSAGDIAEACGCSVQNIQLTEKRALRKLRIALEQRGITNLEQLV